MTYDPICINYPERLLAFDQALANTGWVLMENAMVKKTGTLKTHSIHKGPEASVLRAQMLQEQIFDLIEEHDPLWVAREMVPVTGTGMRRPDSSLCAAVAIQIACARQRVPLVVVNDNHAKKRLTGDSKADKKDVRAAVLRELPEITDYKPLNEHVYDAAAVALIAIEEGPK